MIRTLLLAALVATPAFAKDPRIATRFYDPSQIVVVHGHTGIQSTIEFGADEHIDNVAVGDSADWQVTPNKHASALTPEPPAQVADKTPEPTPADLNFAWTSAGAKQLLPARTFDDGKATWLAWPKDSAMPAILVREPNGEEGPVNYRVQGDYVVVDGVPAQLVLRAGKLLATLTPSPRPAAPQPQPAALPGGAQTASAKP